MRSIDVRESLDERLHDDQHRATGRATIQALPGVPTVTLRAAVAHSVSVVSNALLLFRRWRPMQMLPSLQLTPTKRCAGG